MNYRRPLRPISFRGQSIEQRLDLVKRTGKSRVEERSYPPSRSPDGSKLAGEEAVEGKGFVSKRRASRAESVRQAILPFPRGRSAVTLALLIACPTKVYHYHCHPLFPNPLSLSPTAHHSRLFPSPPLLTYPLVVVAAQLAHQRTLRCVQVKRWIPFGGPSPPPYFNFRRDHDPFQLARFPFPSNAHLTS